MTGQARDGAWRALVAGALVVGVLDALAAVAFAGLRGVGPERVFQGIASGLLGRDAFRGGLATATLGVAIHFFIASVVVAVYYLASRRLDVLTRRAVPCGLLYGVAVFVVMQRLVIPLSAIGPRQGPRDRSQVARGMAIHLFLVGLPSAIAARQALRRGRSDRAPRGPLPAGMNQTIY